jgi:hypothetical protein
MEMSWSPTKWGSTYSGECVFVGQKARLGLIDSLQTIAVKCWYCMPIVQTEHVPVEHVSVERIIKAATIDESIFTQDEFDHVENCSACFQSWVGLIKNLS